MKSLKKKYDTIQDFSKRHTKARHSIIAVVGAFAIAAHSETVGYKHFNTPSGWNPVCTLDPYCRKLSDDEITWAQQFFGDDIDYKSVNYFSRQMIGSDSEGLAYHARGSIYEGTYWDRDIAPYPNFVDEVFIHEMTHVWQYQTGRLLDIPENEVSDHDKIYAYNIDAHEYFREFGVEQQASIVGDIAAKRLHFNDIADKAPPKMLRNIYKQCKMVNKLEEKAAQMLPIEITDCDALYWQDTPTEIAISTPEI